MPQRARVGGLFALFAGALLIAGAQSVQAQSAYSFSRDSAEYRDLTGATKIPIALGDTLIERHHIGLNGEVFSFFRRPYAVTDSSGIQVSSFGYVRLENDTSLVIIDGIFGTLAPRDASSAMSYLIEGGPGERIVKAEWKNVGFGNGGPGDFANFQIWIYQKTGVIEIRIGPGSVARLDTIGAWMGTFIAPHNFSYTIDKLWIGGDPSKPQIDMKKNFNFAPLTALPSNGAIFRLTPRGTLGAPEEKDGEKEMGELRIYPNPATSELVVETARQLDRGASLRIVDMAGEVVASMPFDGVRGTVDLSPYPSGTYLVELSDAGTVLRQKIAKP